MRQVMREIVESLVPPEGSRARVEIEPERMAVVLEGGPPEVFLQARIFHGDDYFAEVTAGEKARLREFTQRLVAIGLMPRQSRPR
jgi:hypothetical protein